jgi:DUF971 family protein
MAEKRIEPIKVWQKSDVDLGILWNDGTTSDYNVVELRRQCPCAHCRDEWTGERRLDPAAIPETARPIEITRVGRYALHFKWDDQHSSGIYSFKYLREIFK